MNHYDDIRRMPTVVNLGAEIGGHTIISPEGIHESVFRSCAILEKAKELLKEGVPGAIVLELIDLMESPLENSPRGEN